MTSLVKHARRQRIGRFLLPLVAVLACDTGPADEPVAEYVLDTPHVLVSLESGLLARPRAIALDPIGQLYVLDQTDRQVVAITPEGSVRGTIAGPGQGPGELTLPLFLGVDGDRLRVFDFGQGSVESFSTGGEYIDQFRPEITGVPSRIAFGPRERLAYSGMSIPDSGGLAAVLDGSSGDVTYVGDLISEETTIPPTLLDQVHARELPAFMRNNALPFFASDGDLWVFLQTESVLKRFGPDGTLAAESRVNIPEMELIQQEFFDWYAAVEAPDMLRYFSYLSDAVAADGQLFLMWNVPGGQAALVTVHDDAGNMTSRLLLRGTPSQDPDYGQDTPTRRLALDVDRRRLYLMERDALTIWWYEVPAEVLGTD